MAAGAVAGVGMRMSEHQSAEQGNIASWRDFVEARATISRQDVAELEGHLRDQIDDLAAAGLSDDEAFLIAVKRMGRLDELSREYAREHSDRLWKQLVVADDEPGASTPVRWLALGLAVAAGLAIQVPRLFGVDLLVEDSSAFYLRNVPVLVLLFPAVYFLTRRQVSRASVVTVTAAFAVITLVINLWPFAPFGDTELIATAHSAVALWLVMGLGYVGGRWRSARARMDFIRFTGEWVVYMVLLAIGGGALIALTFGVFGAIGVFPGEVIATWVIPSGFAGAVMIAAWLVEAKQSVIENIAPVLTKVFTPLVTALLLVLIVAGFVQGSSIDSGRDLLIICDVVLLVVVGLLLYALSARPADAPAGWFDRMQFVMMVASIAIDIFVLIAMLGRIGEFGLSANKLASLGVNIILLANLAGASWLQLGFLRHRTRTGRLERWQTSFVPVYLGWALFAVLVIPPLFGFV